MIWIRDCVHEMTAEQDQEDIHEEECLTGVSIEKYGTLACRWSLRLAFVLSSVRITMIKKKLNRSCNDNTRKNELNEKEKVKEKASYNFAMNRNLTKALNQQGDLSQ